MKITHKHLEGQHACYEHLDLFDKLFPTGAEITLENLQTAAAAGLDIDWMVSHFVLTTEQKYYSSAYWRKIKPACHNYTVKRHELGYISEEDYRRQDRILATEFFKACVKPAWALVKEGEKHNA